MAPTNIFDTAHSVREDQYEESTDADVNNNTGRTTVEATIKNHLASYESILQKVIGNHQDRILWNVLFTDFICHF